MAPPSLIKVITPVDKKGTIQELPLPKLRDDYILVRVVAVGLNPTDWKHIAGLIGYDATGTRVGCDYAGIVEEVGSKVTTPWKQGDRIAGFIHGSNASNLEDGAFAEYAVAKGDMQIKIPDNVTDVEAATLGVGVSTCGQALYLSLKLPLPDKPSKTPIPLLIYGGSTATGILAIQYAKLSGCTVVATSSPRNFDYLKSLGADAVFDYNSASVVADIRAFTKGQLRHALDCICEPATTRISVGALADEGGVYTTLQPVQDDAVRAINPRAANALTVAYRAIGEPYRKFGRDTPGDPAEFAFAKDFAALTQELLASGKLKPARAIVNQGGKGLEGVLKGLEDLKNGKVSGAKLVYTL